MNAGRIAVAYSGGRDSTALLHATLVAAAEQGIEVFALHVHHGLSPNADAWLAHCEQQCRRWARAGKPIAFAADRLTTLSAHGESIEAWARQARYRALREMALAHSVTIVLLAHHRRDQAETLLLQALRGGGVAGLAGMPRSVLRDGITWQRPWLDKPRAEVDAYVRRHRLKFIEDDSNADPRFARNRLRSQVWPALAAAFEQAEAAPGTMDGTPFAWIADADPRLGPVLEAVLDGTYYWVPLQHVAEIKIDPPADLRDQVWLPVNFTWTNGGTSIGFVPSRYPSSATAADPLLALARRTEWQEHGAPDDGWALGLGQRMLTTGDADVALLDLRHLVFGARPGGAATPS